MKPFTVFFAHSLPMNMGIAALHLQYVEAESAEAAGEGCKRSLGGYAKVLLVFEGHVKPVIEHELVHTEEKFEIALQKERAERERKHKEDPKNPAYFPLPSRKK